MNNFDDAARLLAQPLGDLLLALPEQTKEEITELRVRRGRPLVVMLGSRTCFLTDGGKLFYPQLGVKLCSMAGGGVQKIYMVFLREPSR